MARKKIIAGIDIGTCNISVVVGEVFGDEVHVIGFNSQPSYGVKKGSIINMDSTVDSIKRAMKQAQSMARSDISAAVVGISGGHIRGMSNSGVVPLSSREVRRNDLSAVLDAAKAVVIPTDREVVQIVPQEFVVDNQAGIKHPLGMSGVRLEARVYIITGAVATAQNVVRCLNRSGLKVQDIILQHLAAAEAVLTPDEKDLGCALVDIGGGTTDIGFFSNGSVRFCSVLPIGGNHITSDIAIGLRTPLAEAEELKCDSGTAFRIKMRQNDTMEVVSIGDAGSRTVSKETLCQIIHARVEETFQLVKKELVQAGCLEGLSSGVVLTGGTAMLSGICQVAQQVLGVPVRVGYPRGVREMGDVYHPMYAGAVGLVYLAGREDDKSKTKKTASAGSGAPSSWGIGGKMKQWFAEAF
jgi:cell division protein FtsA